MRPLLLAVFGSVSGLLNMTLFLLLMNFLAALLALQLFQVSLFFSFDRHGTIF